MWAFAEAYVAIIVGSIPPCRSYVIKTLNNSRFTSWGRFLGGPQAPQLDHSHHLHGLPSFAADRKGSKPFADFNSSTDAFKSFHGSDGFVRISADLENPDSSDGLVPLHSKQFSQSFGGITRTMSVDVDYETYSKDSSEKRQKSVAVREIP